ncbi:MAG: glycosyltransferase family 1 protein, partial [Flavobacterium sp.]
MKSLLYIGNKLSRHGSTATAIETLGPLLEADGFLVRYASSKKNKLLRMIDMAWTTFAGRKKIDYVLIDTYSTQNFWYAVLVAWICNRLKLKYIPILHGGNLPSRLRSNPKLCKMVFGSAYKNVAPSGYLADAFRDAG